MAFVRWAFVATSGYVTNVVVTDPLEDWPWAEFIVPEVAIGLSDTSRVSPGWTYDFVEEEFSPPAELAPHVASEKAAAR